MTDVVLTTNPGLEDIVYTELTEQCQQAGITVIRANVVPRCGRVHATLDALPHHLPPLIAPMCTIHHARRPLLQFTLTETDPLGDLHQRLAACPIPELQQGESFRVTGIRRGEHSFTSMELQRVAGAGIRARHAAPVSMKAFDVEIRAEVRDSSCTISVQLTRRALSLRSHWPHRPRTALKANVAHAMLRLTLDGQPPPRTLLDPFCGSGTLLITAAQHHPSTSLIGVDKYHRAVEGARANLTALALADRATIHEADGRQLRKLLADREGGIDAIITNPPFGVRIGSTLDFEILFDALLTDAAFLLRDGGRIAVLVWQRRAFNRALRRRGGDLESVHVRIIETGNLFPGLFILQRKPRLSR